MINCPKCNRDDTVQKVSAIVDSGHSSGSIAGPGIVVSHSQEGTSFGSSYFVGNTQSSTQLARKLAPPVKPSPPSNGFKFYIGWAGVLIFGLCSLINIGMGFEGGGGDFIPIVITIISIVLIWSAVSDKNAKQEPYRRNLEQWKADMNEWEQLYYCHRDDIMFNPSSGEVWTFTRAV